jgi:hypothetical protein
MITAIIDRNKQWTCKECGHLNTPNDFALDMIDKGHILISTCQRDKPRCEKMSKLIK